MATIDITIPNQGVQPDNWKTIFLDSSGNPAFFVNTADPYGVANNLIVSLLIIATIAAIGWMGVAAWGLVTSGGDTEKYTAAKKGILNAVIGIAVIVAMWALIAAIRWLARGVIG